jgi:hypothetical protein
MWRDPQTRLALALGAFGYAVIAALTLIRG